MKRSLLHGLSLSLLIMFIASSCKKDNQQIPQPEKNSISVQKSTKLNITEQDKTQINDTSSGVSSQLQRSEPEPDPWVTDHNLSASPQFQRTEPEPDPWKTGKN
jgi:hypothetical protein